MDDVDQKMAALENGALKMRVLEPLCTGMMSQSSSGFTHDLREERKEYGYGLSTSVVVYDFVVGRYGADDHAPSTHVY